MATDVGHLLRIVVSMTCADVLMVRVFDCLWLWCHWELLVEDCFYATPAFHEAVDMCPLKKIHAFHSLMP